MTCNKFDFVNRHLRNFIVNVNNSNVPSHIAYILLCICNK